MNLRLKKLQRKLASAKLDAFLVTHPLNIRYLSGFWGKTTFEREAFLLIFPKRTFFITSALYLTQVKKSNKEFNFCEATYQRGTVKILKLLLAERSVKKLAFESNNLTVAENKNLQKKLKIKLIPTQNLIENLRIIKEQNEIQAISKACQVADETMEYATSLAKPGLSEKELAQKIRIFAYQKTGEVPPEPVVATGKNSALPHHTSTDKRLKKGDQVLIDFMAKINGYYSDLTRVFFLGKPTAKQRRLHNFVLSTQRLCLANIKSGVKANRADKMARERFKEECLDRNFTHALGHGLGLAEHERPFLAPGSKEVLGDNMVFTIEPGIYLPDWGGIRIEDTVLLKNGKPQVLTKFPKEITVI